jgi:hypothetical protein
VQRRDKSERKVQDQKKDNKDSVVDDQVKHMISQQPQQQHDHQNTQQPQKNTHEGGKVRKKNMLFVWFIVFLLYKI